jgi:hypothetical protein
MMITAVFNASTLELQDYRAPWYDDETRITAGTKVIEFAADEDRNLFLDGPRSVYLHVSGGADLIVDLQGWFHTDHMLFQEASGDLVLKNGTIDMDDRPDHDGLGFGFSRPGNIVLQDLRICAVHGSQAGKHGDGAQCYTNMGKWFINRVFMSSYYQCLFVANKPDRACDGIHITDSEFHDLAGAAKALWFGDHGFAEQYALDGKPRVTLNNVFVRPFEDRLLRDCVHPGPGATWNGVPIGVVTDDDWASCSWPVESGIVGRVFRI